jgi:hypothetical protein
MSADRDIDPPELSLAYPPKRHPTIGQRRANVNALDRPFYYDGVEHVLRTARRIRGDVPTDALERRGR